MFKKVFIILFISLLAITCSKKEKNDKSKVIFTKENSKNLIKYIFDDNYFNTDPGFALDFSLSTIYLFNSNSISKINGNSEDTVFFANVVNGNDTVKVFYIKRLRSFYALFSGCLNEMMKTDYHYFTKCQMFGVDDKALTLEQVMAKKTVVKYKFDGEYDFTATSTSIKDTTSIMSKSNFGYTIDIVNKCTYNINGDADIDLKINENKFYYTEIFKDFKISELEDYPEGILRFEGANSSYIELLFDGTNIVNMTVFDGNNTYTLTFNTETLIFNEGKYFY